ncbi:MAG: nuclear transport factor 2 family protein [Bradyrhizobium sp.]|uniref:nuclear transport factor 2 family protein n=1 Tax=Bradyrhizobium sp. TaxID=376 RepID=UPI0029A46E80|nr:nuclear transport factor 2 family protein [Bradyrhizobium sp.]MDX3969226.1 nuclear transport factor 2 family protein [Bradyrhizobium sp.]
MHEGNGAVYLADLLALQMLNANLTERLNKIESNHIGQFFTEEAVYEDNHNELKGASAIQAHFSAMASRTRTRHSFSLCNIAISEGGRASGVLSYIKYSEGQPGAPLISVNDVDDRYELGIDGIWRIATRRVTLAF